MIRATAEADTEVIFRKLLEYERTVIVCPTRQRASMIKRRLLHQPAVAKS